MSHSRSLSMPRRSGLLALATLAMATSLVVTSAFGQEGATRTPIPGEPRDPSAPAGTDAADLAQPVITTGGTNKKKQKVPKLTAEQKKRKEIEASGLTAMQWYDRAVAIYRTGKYMDARAILLPLEDSARALDIQEQVKLLIADTYFAQGGALNLAEALARYKSFSTFFPSSEHAEYVQFQIGRSYYKQLAPADRDQSVTDSVVAEYKRFLELFPESEHAEQARKELAEATILRARSEFEVAKFYWEWKDYRAAATRLRTVLWEWPELPEREQALYMGAQSFYNSGDRAEGDAYAARLAEDYPGSTWMGKLDAGAAGGKTIEQQVQRQAKAEKQSARTAQRQMRSDRKRTKQIRKDSGLPGNVPGDSEVATVATSSAPAGTGDASAPAEGAAAPAASPALTTEQEARSAEAEKRDRERIEKLEAEEAAKAASQAEQQTKREAKDAAEAAKAAEKAAKDAAKLEGMSDAQREELAAKEAKAAAAEKERVDKLEAAEAKKASQQAEQQKAREEKEAAEAAKKAEKKAKKAEKGK